ncbi:N-acetylglutaminylglutamine amidotransferase [Thioalkalivibrio sp. XN8]|uniref:N-acetylglutaminylglutamine amidotransferase n=1 Tax=Thioalkalivibrio sp. XN8 TaxID=2712863 RepID=UPI0013ECF4E6|nr:N-acetylglutaminylglutamine amidotransferase [Thioalkalivibrio sp. XN8]NGP54758.1 N-acetylglutaminylglutamine amidotransferase [Thioalkalivibrio sp. XN8]
MCGIAGEMRFDGAAADPGRVQRMLDLMSARGPDDDGLVAQGRVALGHRRLAIVDLSERGAQPMRDHELGLTIVFNGCIYNHDELRRRLTGEGYRFFSRSDTEVIVKAYHAWGERCVDEFKGMFAFCIREHDSGRLFLARDRLGIKPLYYTHDEGVFRFASSLPALLRDGLSTRELDPAALHHYMSFHSVVPAPMTLLKAVRKLAPGCWLRLATDGTVEEHRYWTLSFGARDGDPRDEREWEDAVLESMRLAVRRRLTGDVPVGVLLSGGLDSSLITGLLAREGVPHLNTFTVGFEDVGKEEGNEFRYSDLVAQTFGTEHHQVFIDAGTLLKHLPGCFSAMAEPMVSHDNIGFYLLSREVSKHVKVVQSGQGADEVFGGYHWYPPLLESTDPIGDYARVFFDRDHEELAEAIDPGLVSRDFSREFVAAHFAAATAEAPVDKALHLDTTVMLVDDPVKRVDNMTMAWGLEARTPFLDHEVVELAARCPAPLKLAQGGKGVLKEAARRVIPDGVIDRPKGYFPVPALKYLRGESLEMVQDALRGQAARQRGIFRPEYVERLLAAPEEHLTPLRGSKLWQLAVLEIWLQTHGV